LTLGILGAPEGEGALRTLATDPASLGLVRPHVLLAAYAARRGDLAEAAAQLEKALSLQPYQVDALILLAQVRGHQSRWGEARACLEEALRFDPQNGTAAEGLRSIPLGPAAP
jgi:tetratricopeptide (TPR) repeat protein